ncbi:hypothetical protein EKO04_006662 [Ascochyta lentis]|uniref:Uncharacterized protein n=1 Tax=Ascochyta lentis TaxID=205686 RepID=A0A8H7J2Z3_9PLEO|nr:hypothetical protein EKO04_006662 [Ascochyta lentis]
MDKERSVFIDGIVDRLANLTAAERTTALTHLFNLRTAAVEDLSDLEDNRRHWNTVLGSPSESDNVKDLVRDLTQLTDEDLATISSHVSERSNASHEQVLQTAAEEERAKLQAQLASSARRARESYIAAQQGLNMQHNRRLVEKMKDIRDAIERGVNSDQDVTSLEEIFARIEREFWDHYPESSGPRIKTEE